MTASGEVIIRLNRTAGVPTSTVSTLASPRPSPTGMKSQPTCAVDGEQGRQRVLHRQGPGRDLRAHQDTDDLGDRRAGPEEGRQERQCHDETDDDQADRVAAQRREQVADPLGDAGVDDEAEQDADVGHERQHGVQRQVDRLPGGGEEGVDDVADAGAELDEEPSRRPRGRASSGRGARGPAVGPPSSSPYVHCPAAAAPPAPAIAAAPAAVPAATVWPSSRDTSPVPTAETKMSSVMNWASGPPGLAGEHVHGRDPLARVDPDAGGAAAVDDRREDFGVLDLGAEPVDRLAAGELGDPLGDRVDAAAGHRDDLVLVRGGGQLQAAAPAAAAGADEDRPEGAPVRRGVGRGHFAPPAAAAAYSASNVSNRSVLLSRRMR